MGLWGSIGSAIGGWLGISYSKSSSTTTNYNHNTETIYEPDKVKVAELEKERAEMLIEGQKEIIELNTRMQGMIIEAEARSFEHSSNVLKSLLYDMNIIAQQRMQLLENGHQEIVERIERMYISFEREIEKDNDSFQLEKLPKMLEMLERFPPESSSHKLYANSVDKQVNLNIEFVSEKLKALKNRQQLMIESSLDTKKVVLEQTANLVEGRMKFLEKQIESRRELALSNSLGNAPQIPHQNSNSNQQLLK